MPYVRCSVCQDMFHLLVRRSISEWEKENVTERSEDGTPLLKCIRCWVELKPGHRVTLRVLPDRYERVLRQGQAGVVKSVSYNNENRIVISFEELDAELTREELNYVAG